jgi:hypothetical protein
MFTLGWLVVLLGVLAIRWADGRFPFPAPKLPGRQSYRLGQRRIIGAGL